MELLVSSHSLSKFQIFWISACSSPIQSDATQSPFPCFFYFQASFSGSGQLNKEKKKPNKTKLKKNPKDKTQANKTWSPLQPGDTQPFRQHWLLHCISLASVEALESAQVFKAALVRARDSARAGGRHPPACSLPSGLPAAWWRQGGDMLANYNRKMVEFTALSQDHCSGRWARLPHARLWGRQQSFAVLLSAWARGAPQVLVDLGWMNSLGFLINSCKNHCFERSATMQTLLDCSRRQ